MLKVIGVAKVSWHIEAGAEIISFTRAVASYTQAELDSRRVGERSK